MPGSFECTREIIVDKSADQIWDWLSDIRNVMTANQYHAAVECDDAAARNVQAGTEFALLHDMMGHKFYRTARIMSYQDYEISWAERVPDDAGYKDSFPHGEGWKVESIGSHRSRMQVSLYGAFMLPIGQLIGQQAWDAAIPVILDNDLQDVAFATGGIARKTPIEMPDTSAALLRLVHAREVDGIPVEEYINISRKRRPRPAHAHAH